MNPRESARQRRASNSIFRQLIGDALPLFLSSGFNAAISTVIVFITARFVSPRDYGAYASVLGGMQFIMAALSGGVSTWSTLQMSQQFDEHQWILPTQIRWYSFLLCTAPALVGLACFALGLSQSLTVAAVVLSAYSVIHAMGDGMASFLLAQRQTALLARANWVETMLSAIFIPTLLVAGGGILGVACGELAASIGRTFMISRAVRRSSSVAFWLPRAAQIRSMLRDSSPLWGIQIIYSANSRLQPLAIALSSATLAGYFAAGNRFLDASVIAMVAFTPVLLPNLTKAKDDLHRHRHMVLIAMLIAVVLAIPISITLAIFGDRVVNLVLGDQYHSVSSALPIIALVVPLTFLAQVLSTALISLDCKAFITRTVAISAVIQVAGIALIARTDNIAMLYIFLATAIAINLAVWMGMFVAKTRISSVSAFSVANAGNITE